MNKGDAVVGRPGSIWLHSESAQTGGHVDLKATSVRLERPETGWLQSSIELHDGLEIAEFSDTMAQETLDRLFRA